MPLGLECQEMIQAAQKARVARLRKLAETGVCSRPAQKGRVAHLTKLAETGVCSRPDGNILRDAVLQFLSGQLLLCGRCGFDTPNHVSHQANGQYGMKHELRCSRCNTEYFSWVENGQFCMRL